MPIKNNLKAYKQTEMINHFSCWWLFQPQQKDAYFMWSMRLCEEKKRKKDVNAAGNLNISIIPLRKKDNWFWHHSSWKNWIEKFNFLCNWNDFQMSAKGNHVGVLVWRSCELWLFRGMHGKGSSNRFHFLTNTMKMAPCFPPYSTSIAQWAPLHVFQIKTLIIQTKHAHRICNTAFERRRVNYISSLNMGWCVQTQCS